jgi:restriction system protein
LEKEAAAAHGEAMQAEVEQLNAELAAQYERIDSLLSATLNVDDYVDLESLRKVVEHPPFDRPDLAHPLPAPAPIPDPILPVKLQAQPPKGLLGRKKKFAEAEALAEAQYAADYWAWHAAAHELPARREAQAAAYAAAEQARLGELEREKARYERECAAREEAIREQNAELDQLISGLGYGTVEAVQEYVGIVLANSVYPDKIAVRHSAQFEPSTAELSMKVLIPGPDRIPTIKGYRYVKASDEIVETQLSQKEAKDRYADLVNNVALRGLHEVFEADRRGLIRSIALELGTETVNPATGRETYVPLAAVAVSRDVFSGIDLSAVVPAATLAHLGAVVSKYPSGLVPVSSAGVRRV